MTARTFRVFSLVVAPVVAAIACGDTAIPLVSDAAPLLIVTWLVMASALVMRALEANLPVRGERTRALRQLDLLTATGAATLWLSALALIAAARLGWASLSVVGMLGLGTVHVVAAWTAIAGSDAGRWRNAVIARALVPAITVEGEPVREEIELSQIRIPAGMRLFAIGRAFPHGALSRYAVAPGAGSKIKLASELGPAPRGDHHAPALALWFGDVLGLTRTPPVHLGEASCCVLPRPRPIDGARALLAHGRDAMRSEPTQRPTEGSFRIREYQPGDDTRRIHWVRSLQHNELVVRLPDEMPVGEPDVRLVLDTEMLGAETLACRAVDDLLDAMVRVWLAVARDLDAAGSRVTLVTAAPTGQGIARPASQISRIEQPFRSRSMRDGLRLGARVTWQADVPLAALIARPGFAGPRSTAEGRCGASIEKRGCHQVVVSYRPRRSGWAVEWIGVPEIAWTSPEPALPTAPTLTLPFPTGCADNRRARIAAEQRRIEAMWQDRAAFSQITCWTEWGSCSGDYLARPQGDRIALAVIP